MGFLSRLFADNGSATSTRSDTPSQPRRQAQATVSPERKAARKHYRRTGDSGPMWAAKARENRR